MGHGSNVEAQKFSPVEINGQWGYKNLQTNKIVIKKLDQALPFKEGIGLAQKNGKWGGFSRSFEVVIPFRFDFLSHLSKNFIIAQKKEELYLLQNDGSKLIDQAFSDIAILGGTSDTMVVADQKGTYGILSPNGNYLIKPAFNTPPQNIDIPSLLVFHQKIRNSYFAGAVDLTGQVIVPFNFLFVKVYGNNLLKGTKLNGDVSYFTIDGKLIYEGNGEGHLVIDDSFILIIKKKEQILHVRSTGISYSSDRWHKLGTWYYGSNKKNKSTVVFSDLGSSFTINDQVFLNDPHDGYIKMSKKTDKGYRYGLIDARGNEVLGLSQLDVREWNDRWAVIKKEGDKLYSLFDMTNRTLVLNAEYTNIQLYPCGYVQLFNHRESKYLNSNLDSIDLNTLSQNQPNHYAWTERQRSDLARKYSYETPGKYIADFQSQADDCADRHYDFTELKRLSLIKDRYGKNPLENRVIFSIETNEGRRSGLLDFNGKVIVPPIYHGLSHQENGYIPFNVNRYLEYKGKSLAGIMDADGHIILDPVYDKIERTVLGVAIVQVHGLYQMVDIESKQVLLSKFQRIRFNGGQHFILFKHGLQGIADQYGRILIETKYTKLSYKPDKTGLYSAERDKKLFYVDLEGNEYPRSE